MARATFFTALVLCLLFICPRAFAPPANKDIDPTTGLILSSSLTQVAKSANLFPLSATDEALLKEQCNGKVQNPNFHPCPIRGACSFCNQTCTPAAERTGWASGSRVTQPYGCGAAVIIKFAQGNINSCNTGVGFGSSQGNVNANGNSQATYYCAATAATGQQCCDLCKKYADGGVPGNSAFKCKSWVLINPNYATENTGCGNNRGPGKGYISQAGQSPDVVTPYYGGCGWCFLLPEDSCAPTCSDWGLYYDNNDNKNNIYWALRGRMGCSQGKNDPHFTGADGTRFEFNGLPDKTFCLVTDKDLHINMKMHGYLDERTMGASIIQNGKGVRTWMRELGFVWNKEGQRHTLYLAARSGNQQEYGVGFLAKAEVDGVAIPRMSAGDSLTYPSGLTVTFNGAERMGPYDVDKYHVSIDGLLEVDLKLRLAHPLLQQPSDAEAHFNIMFGALVQTDTIHGVIGQTYRNGRTVRALEYRALAALIGHPVAADESGMGYLDGTTDDYVSSDILSPDCRFTAFA